MRQAAGEPCNHWIASKEELLAIAPVTEWRGASLNEVYNLSKRTYQIETSAGKFAGNYVRKQS